MSANKVVKFVEANLIENNRTLRQAQCPIIFKRLLKSFRTLPEHRYKRDVNTCNNCSCDYSRNASS
jgi:hypothetical protein